MASVTENNGITVDMKIISKIFNTAKHVNLQLQRLQQLLMTFHTLKHSTCYHKTTGLHKLENYSQLDIYEFIHSCNCSNSYTSNLQLH